jgi:hypothetical protein
MNQGLGGASAALAAAPARHAKISDGPRLRENNV